MAVRRARIGLTSRPIAASPFAYWYNHAPEGGEIVPTFIGFRSEKQKSFSKVLKG
jgi:hypothetical protein